MDDDMFMMKEQILEVGGGWGLCVRDNDSDSKALISHGELRIVNDTDNKIELPPDVLLPLISERNGCHENSEKLHLLTDGKYKAYTGYYMNADDYLWRQHSWTVNQETNCIVDNNRDNIRYYGVAKPLPTEEDLKHVAEVVAQMRKDVMLCPFCLIKKAGHQPECVNTNVVDVSK